MLPAHLIENQKYVVKICYHLGSFEICEAFKTEYSDAVNVDKQVLAVNSVST